MGGGGLLKRGRLGETENTIYPILYYGNGNIYIEKGDRIIGFDITLNGKYIINSSTDTFTMFSNKTRIIGFSLNNSAIGEEPFLTYTGDLTIKKVKLVSDDFKIVVPSVKLLNIDKFGRFEGEIEYTDMTFDELNRGKEVGTIPKIRKTEWVNKNFHTEGGEFLLNNKNYTGDYHLHSNGKAMTGSDHTENSEELILQDKQKNIKKSIYTGAVISRIRGRGGY